MLRIDLLRHGEAELSHCLRGSTDDALTLLGWQQMRDTVSQYQLKLEPPIWDAIYCSPLQRCHQFAMEISELFNLPLLIDPKLQEIHFGDWEGMTTQDIYNQYPDDLAQFWKKPTTFTPPNAESIQYFDQRATQAFLDLKEHALNMKWLRILVITHGGVIKLLKIKVLNKPLDDILQMSAELGQLNAFQFVDSDDLVINQTDRNYVQRNDFKINHHELNHLKLIYLDEQNIKV